jgi:hypothetical protein
MLEYQKRSFLIWWSLWKSAMPALCNVTISIGCYVAGWTVSDEKSSAPFARAGAAATAAAILFNIYDFQRALAINERQVGEKIARATRHLKITGSASKKRIELLLNRNTYRATRNITIINATTLIVATLVWGFGDLITKSPHHCG